MASEEITGSWKPLWHVWLRGRDPGPKYWVTSASVGQCSSPRGRWLDR